MAPTQHDDMSRFFGLGCEIALDCGSCIGCTAKGMTCPACLVQPRQEPQSKPTSQPKPKTRDVSSLCVLLCFCVCFVCFCAFLCGFAWFFMFSRVFGCFCALGAILGARGALLGILGSILAALGTLLGALGALLAALGALLGALGALLGALGAMLALSCKKTSKKSKMIRKFGFNLGGKMGPKSLKIDVKSQHGFRHLFFTIFYNFSLILEVEFQWFFDGFLDLKRKRRFCKN